MDVLREKILMLADELHPRVVKFRRSIHRTPELSFREEQTAGYIQSILSAGGIKTVRVGKHHSFIAIVEGSGNGPTLGLRAELDALPVQESTALSFASANSGVMHACGHDLHIASAIGVALLLSKIKAHWGGRAVLVFESGEEVLPGGAADVLQSAEFRAVMPGAMLALHVFPELAAGKVGFCAGRYMASGDEVYLTVRGKGGHAALPHTLVDSVVMASSIILGLQTLVSRNAPALIPTVLSFGRVEANGATNVIPDEVRIEGTFRTMDEAWRAKAHGLIEANAQGIAGAMGGHCDVEIRRGYPSVYNAPELTARARASAVELLGAESVVELEPRMTTDDFAYFGQAIPSLFFRLGVGTPGAAPGSLHSPTFVANEDALRVSVALLSWLLASGLR